MFRHSSLNRAEVIAKEKNEKIHFLKSDPCLSFVEYNLLGMQWRDQYYLINACSWAAPVRAVRLSYLTLIWNGWPRTSYTSIIYCSHS